MPLLSLYLNFKEDFGIWIFFPTWNNRPYPYLHLETMNRNVFSVYEFDTLLD